MNFELISPVGADVDPMPKTRPDRMTGTSASTPTPWRRVHRLLPHYAIHITQIMITSICQSTAERFSLTANAHTFLAALARKSLSRSLYRCLRSLSFLRSTIHFYCHLRNSAHYHNNNTERGEMRSLRTTDHESPTVRDGK